MNLSWLPKEKKAQIYAIVNDDNEIRYIGSSMNAEQRYKEHQYRDYGGLVILQIVREPDRFQKEYEYIQSAFADGHPLLNKVRGMQRNKAVLINLDEETFNWLKDLKWTEKSSVSEILRSWITEKKQQSTN